MLNNVLTNQLIFIMLDGLKYSTAVQQLGYMHHLVEHGLAARFKVKSELPSLSRPLYEVLLTGTPVYRHGITTNHTVRLSHEQSLFHLTRQHGLTNATAAYHWVSELYNKAPFNPMTDRYQWNTDLPIQHGTFYWEDHYPDSHLFADAQHLLQTAKPDFLYLHTMNIDDEGHKHSGNSAAYRNRAIAADMLLAHTLPYWTSLGYQIIVTADHGMNDDGMHNGTTDDERSVPLYVISSKVQPGVYEEAVSQLQIAPLACHLLNIRASNVMLPLTILQAEPVPSV